MAHSRAHDPLFATARPCLLPHEGNRAAHEMRQDMNQPWGFWEWWKVVACFLPLIGCKPFTRKQRNE